MGDTPLRLDSANDGNLKQMTTAEENYLAYHAGLHLSVLDSSDVWPAITTTSSGNSLVGTFTDTTFDDGVGTHGFSGGNVPVVQTTTSLYQREGVTDWHGDSADRRYPIEFVDNSGDAEIHEFDSSELDTISDRLIGRIMTSEYPEPYRLGTSAPNGDYSVYKSGVFEDRLQTGVSGTVYNLYVRSSMTAPATSRTVGIKRVSGATGTFQGLQEMTDVQIRYSFGARLQSRIMNGNYGVGTYLLRSSAQGAPTETGTWLARGTATDTRRDVSDVDYTRTSTRTSGGVFTRNFEGNYTRVTSTRNSTSVFTGNFTRDFLGNYTRVTSTRTSTQDFLGNYTGNFEGNYTRTFTGNYSRDFAGNFTGDFAGDYAGNFSTAFTGNFTRVTSTRNSTRNSTRTSTRTRVTDYVSNYAGNFAGNFAGDFVGNFLRSTTYVGNFVGNYGVYAYQRTSTRQSINTVDSARVSTRTSTRTSTRDSTTTFTGNFAGNFTGDFTLILLVTFLLHTLQTFQE